MVSSISQGFRKDENLFDYNKDAGMFVCPAGHMAIRKARHGEKNNGENQATAYYFDVEKCKICPLRENCYKPGAKSKTYSVTIKSDLHKEQIAFQKTEYYKKKTKERYKIEAKNSELKNVHGYRRATSARAYFLSSGIRKTFSTNLRAKSACLKTGTRIS